MIEYVSIAVCDRCEADHLITPHCCIEAVTSLRAARD